MARLTIDINAELERRLNVKVAEYNLRNETALTLDTWLRVHLREVGTNDDLAQAAKRIAEEATVRAEIEAAAALQAEKNRLMGLVT